MTRDEFFKTWPVETWDKFYTQLNIETLRRYKRWFELESTEGLSEFACDKYLFTCDALEYIEWEYL